MIGPEIRHTEGEKFLPLITPGSARFIAAAHKDIAAKRFYNPQPLHFDKIGDDTNAQEALTKARYYNVDIDLVSKLSTGLREAVTQHDTQQGKSRQDILVGWAEEMVGFFQNLGKVASPQLKELTMRTLDMNLEETDPRILWQQTQSIWEKYLADGSDIERFFQDVMKGIPNRLPESIAEMQKRIQLVRPLLGIFGDERIEILAADAENAKVVLEGRLNIKNNVVEDALAALQQDFTSENERQAYLLVWEAIKDQIPQRKPTTPPPQPAPVAPPSTAGLEEQQEEIQEGARGGKTSPSHPSSTDQKNQQKPPQQPQSQQPSQTLHRPSPEEPFVVTPREPPQRENQLSQSSVLTASIVARNPERPWVIGDKVFAEKVGGGFALGAFDALDEGGVYSAAVAHRLQHLFVKYFRMLGDTPQIDTALRQAIHIFEDAESFIMEIRKGADNQLRRLKAGRNETKRVIDDIGTTGLVAFVAKDGDRNLLVTINMGNSRLIAFNPKTGSIESLTADGTLAQRKLRIGQLSSQDEAFVDYQRNSLSRWVRPTTINELKQKLEEQLLNGWSKTDEVLRVFPYRPDTLYLVLTNGILLNIRPHELPEVIQRAYTSAQSAGQIDMKTMVHTIAREAHKRMQHPQKYEVTVRGKTHPYIVSDDIAAAGVLSPRSI